MDYLFYLFSTPISAFNSNTHTAQWAEPNMALGAPNMVRSTLGCPCNKFKGSMNWKEKNCIFIFTIL